MTPVREPLGAFPRGPVALSDMAMPKLLNEVVAAGYDGEPWRELLRRLVPGTIRNLSHAIASGQIHRRWAAIGIGAVDDPALRRHPIPDEIAAEAVEDTVYQLKTKLLPQGAWDQAGQRSLEDSFAGWALKPAVNAYRRALTEKRHEVPADPFDSEGTVLPGRWGESPDPADVVCQREELRALETLTHSFQIAVALEAAGWSRAEIVTRLGISPDALRTRLSRARRMLAQQNPERHR
jgi:hypothetical protein